MDTVKKIREFLNFWHIRYLVATELYMVEPWEKATVYALFATIFFFFWYFNYSIICSGISQLRNHIQTVEE